MNLKSVLLLATLGSGISGESGWGQNARATQSPLSRPGPRAVQRELPSAPVLKPGIYETAPYACIVVVPPPHADDRAVIDPGGRVASMPMITVEPQLRLIPRKPRN